MVSEGYLMDYYWPGIDRIMSINNRMIAMCASGVKQSRGNSRLTEPSAFLMDPCLYSLKPAKKVRVEITVIFLKIGEIDTLKENYEADVMIQSKWREPTLDKSQPDVTFPVDWTNFWNPKLFIENTIGDPKESAFLMVTYNSLGEAYVIEKRRVKGTFLENLELDEFPFDIQDLTVTLMSDRPAGEVELAENPLDLHKVNRQSFIDEQEWLLYKCVETEMTEVSHEHEDPNVKRSALRVKCRAARRPAYFFWNIFLITFLISSLSFVTFAVDEKLPQNRLQLSFTLVLTSVAFKFVVNQSLPKISYLTYLDKYVLVAMIMLTVVCIWHGLTTVIGEYAYVSVDTAALITFVGIYFMFNFIFILRIYMKPGRTRRLMREKEKEYAERLDAQLERQQQSYRLLGNHNGVFSVTAI